MFEATFHKNKNWLSNNFDSRTKDRLTCNYMTIQSKLTTIRRKLQSPNGEPCYFTVPYQANNPDRQGEKQNFSHCWASNKFSPAFIILLTLDNTSKKHDKVLFLRFLAFLALTMF